MRQVSSAGAPTLALAAEPEQVVSRFEAVLVRMSCGSYYPIETV